MEKLNHTWLTLQCCFNQILLNNSNNNYNIDHIVKKLECMGQLLDVLDVVEEGACLFNTNTNMNNTSEVTNNKHMTITTT